MNKLFFLLLTLTTLAACSNYGKKVKSGHVEMYYKEGILESEAQKTAAMIERIDKGAGNDISNTKSFQMIRQGDTALLRMVVQKDKMAGVKDENFIGLANMVSDTVLQGRPVNVDLTDDHFKSFHIVRYRKFEEDGNTAMFGEKISSGNVEVYMKGTNETEGDALAGYLEEHFKPSSVFSFQMLKDAAGNYVVKMVGNPDRINSLDSKFFAEVCKGICDKLHVPSVTFEMTDEKFNTLRTFNYPADTGNSDINN